MQAVVQGVAFARREGPRYPLYSSRQAHAPRSCGVPLLPLTQLIFHQMETLIQPKSLSSISLVKYSIHFFGAHFLLVFSAGLIAALGRAIQLGAMSEVSAALNTLLEIIIESARVMTFLLALGEGSIGKGVRSISSIFHLTRTQWKSTWLIIINRLKANWLPLVINLLVFSAIAFVMNFIIDKVAYRTELLATLQSSDILDPQASEWVLLLFFKNLTVIPFTIIFNCLLLLWLTDNLTNRKL
jgi:hypothetical protein